MGMQATTPRLTYARNDYIGQGRSHIFDKVGDMIYYAALQNFGKEYWVDSVNGADTNTGRDFEKPVLTIVQAITLSNTDIALTANANKNNTIFIAGGDYDENITTGANNCNLVGLDFCRSGWSPRLTGHIALDTTTMGMRLFNLEVQADAAGTSGVKLSGTVFNFEMHNCEIRSPGATGAGFETAASSVCYYTKIEDCEFTAAHQYGLYFGGKMKATRILNSRINARTAGILTTNAASVEFDSLIKDNIIFKSDNATETDLTYGIRFEQEDRNPEIMVVHNWIAATYCISYAATNTNYWQNLRCIDNRCVDAADGTAEYITAYS